MKSILGKVIAAGIALLIAVGCSTPRPSAVAEPKGIEVPDVETSLRELKDPRLSYPKRNLAAQLLGEQEAGVTALVAEVDNPDPTIRFLVAAGLFGDREPRQEAALETLLFDANERVAWAALCKLARWSATSSRVPPRVLQFTTDRYPAGFRTYAVDVYLSLHPTPDLAPIRKLAHDPSPEVRAAVYTAIGKYLGKDGKDILRSGLRDPDRTVREAASAGGE